MWPFHTDARVLELTRKLKGAAKLITGLRTQLAEAHAAVAEVQLKQQRAKETYERIRAAEKDITVQRIAELDDLREQVEVLRQLLEEATGPDAVSVDLDRLARELTAVRQDLARAQRRWDSHAYGCERAQQVEAEDAGKRASDL